jgi:hypothetical protein
VLYRLPKNGGKYGKVQMTPLATFRASWRRILKLRNGSHWSKKKVCSRVHSIYQTYSIQEVFSVLSSSIVPGIVLEIKTPPLALSEVKFNYFSSKYLSVGR